MRITWHVTTLHTVYYRYRAMSFCSAVLHDMSSFGGCRDVGFLYARKHSICTYILKTTYANIYFIVRFSYKNNQLASIKLTERSGDIFVLINQIDLWHEVSVNNEFCGFVVAIYLLRCCIYILAFKLYTLKRERSFTWRFKPCQHYIDALYDHQEQLLFIGDFDLSYYLHKEIFIISIGIISIVYSHQIGHHAGNKL